MTTVGDLAELGVRETPLVELRSVAPADVRIFAKCEWHHPTGSIKDRVAAAMMLDARKKGLVEPGVRLIEPSSGNTGIALARICAMSGLDLTVVVPDNVTRERLLLLEAHGAHIVYSPGDQGSNGAVTRAEKMATDGDVVMLHQYENAANPRVHEMTTGPEIVTQLREIGLSPNAVVAALGTGGTLMGVGAALSNMGLRARLVAAEPPVGESISGLRSMADGYVPPIFSPERLDGRILVRAAPALAMMRRLLTEEGLFVGPSSGAAVHAAVRTAEKLGAGTTVVVILPDAGWKYLSTRIYDGPIEEIVEEVSTLTMW